MNKYFRWAILLPSFWLICHIFLIGYGGFGKIPFAGSGFSYLAQLGALSDFKMFRNLFYAAYCALLFGLMVYKLVAAHSTTSIDFTQKATQQIVVALIIATFAYAIAGILLDIMVLFR